jgi:hypothetical protein
MAIFFPIPGSGFRGQRIDKVCNSFMTIARGHKGTQGKDHVWSSTRGNTSGKTWGSDAHLHLAGESTPGSIAAYV